MPAATQEGREGFLLQPLVAARVVKVDIQPLMLEVSKEGERTEGCGQQRVKGEPCVPIPIGFLLSAAHCSLAQQPLELVGATGV